MRVKQALILIGGKGTAGAASKPAPLLEIEPGLRFLDLILEQFARHGFTDIVLLSGDAGDEADALYQGRRVADATVSVVREPVPAGTGGALLHAAGRLDSWFLVADGHALFDINLRALAGRQPRGVGRLALRRAADDPHHAGVELAGDRIAAFHEAPRADAAGTGLVDGGIRLLSRSVLEWLRPRCSLEHDIFPELTRAGALEGRPFDGYFIDIGLPGSLERARAELPRRRLRPAAFLDRDGVLNADTCYVHRPEELTWLDGARESVLRLNEAGYLVIVVANQAGVARGYYTETHIARFHEHMQDDLAALGAHIDAFYYCPYHPEAAVTAYAHADHPDRKPNPGMIMRALREWPITRAGSFLVGDRDTDIAAARRAGLPGYLFDSNDLRTVVETALREQSQ